MKLAVKAWAVKLERNGKKGWDNYYGYDTKREAEARAEKWREAGFNAEVIKR